MRKTALCMVTLLLVCNAGLGQQYNVLYSFAGAQAGDGARPVSSLVFDRSGNLYGTTSSGGSSAGCFAGCGTVFELASNPDGSWSETVLYSFCTNFVNGACLDGEDPTAGLAFDTAGNLYGTTTHGGPLNNVGDCGVVFELSPPSLPGGSWTESVLYDFCSNYVNGQYLDGLLPHSQLTFDGSGNLYGTTSVGGSGHADGGTVFELSRQGGGGGTEAVLYNFCSLGQGKSCPDGTQPMAGVTFDKAGNLYGTTSAGGNFYSQGAVYKLSPGQTGWTETVLLTSKQSLAQAPLGAVSFGPSGNLYSTFSLGGQSGGGGVFRSGPHGGFTEFSFNGNNGDGPTAGALIDTKRSALYGTTSQGGANFSGVVFKMTAPEEETVLYSFCSQPNCTDGATPLGSVIVDHSGNLYGTAKLGGPNGFGVVFEIVP